MNKTKQNDPKKLLIQPSIKIAEKIISLSLATFF